MGFESPAAIAGSVFKRAGHGGETPENQITQNAFAGVFSGLVGLFIIFHWIRVLYIKRRRTKVGASFEGSVTKILRCVKTL
jgi:hypothetical protein